MYTLSRARGSARDELIVSGKESTPDPGGNTTPPISL
jgi:hypothetical protein